LGFGALKMNAASGAFFQAHRHSEALEAWWRAEAGQPAGRETLCQNITLGPRSAAFWKRLFWRSEASVFPKERERARPGSKRWRSAAARIERTGFEASGL